ncbi:hypothetical protein OL239_13140 [Arthrobacter sp. ATA002]|uniref:hypothetical protein n=1 Tax=Arthrobacter sp. ATA002 TaxID=2991715 RepID=UPI0022A6866E|nr:hypothetical protein [Arthrobacter sp. ATA002]WAP50910.1 hypothetical protein OL239_13140 [Arthrobacter sp. ATA002]
MLKHAAKTRQRTRRSTTAQMTAIIAGCALVAGGVSAAEISMLNNSRADSSVSTQTVP